MGAVDNGGMQRPGMRVEGDDNVMHWHVKPNFVGDSVTPITDPLTYWHHADAHIAYVSLEESRVRLKYWDFTWNLIECESLECLINALAC